LMPYNPTQFPESLAPCITNLLKFCVSLMQCWIGLA
ncbi:hypothetical protein T07_4832, partial [Trichinella nelsoni]